MSPTIPDLKAKRNRSRRPNHPMRKRRDGELYFDDAIVARLANPWRGRYLGALKSIE
jgi:hypothetical protein